jgi:ABC-type transporter MlaC component
MEKSRCSGRPATIWLLAAGIMLVSLVSQAAAATPLEVVKKANESVLSIYKKHQVVDASVEKEIFTIIDGVTDYKALSEGAIEGFCPNLTAAQCAKFKQVFTKLLRISSIKKLGRNRADSFEYGGETVTGDSAVVKSFAFFDSERIPLDYQMARRGDGWVIVNYVIDEVDTVRNYRKQFTQLLAKKSFDQVIGQLERKISVLEKEK